MLTKRRIGRNQTHSRYMIFQMAEVAVPRDLFAAILAQIGRLAIIGTEVGPKNSNLVVGASEGGRQYNA